MINKLTEIVGLDMVFDGSSEDYVASEIEKQKRKLKEMSKMMEKQHNLLRLIVQVGIILTCLRDL